MRPEAPHEDHDPEHRVRRTSCQSSPISRVGPELSRPRRTPCHAPTRQLSRRTSSCPTCEGGLRSINESRRGLLLRAAPPARREAVATYAGSPWRVLRWLGELVEVTSSTRARTTELDSLKRCCSQPHQPGPAASIVSPSLPDHPPPNARLTCSHETSRTPRSTASALPGDVGSSKPGRGKSLGRPGRCPSRAVRGEIGGGGMEESASWERVLRSLWRSSSWRGPRHLPSSELA